jgi:hypothetical protein
VENALSVQMQRQLDWILLGLDVLPL